MNNKFRNFMWRKHTSHLGGSQVNSTSIFKNMCQFRNMLTLLIGISLCALYFIWMTKGQVATDAYPGTKSEILKTIPSVSINETSKICNIVNLDGIHEKSAQSFHDLPRIYFITPTYPRREQVAEITRLGQTLMHIENLFWIVADDNELCNPVLSQLLKKFDIPFVHISSPMPDVYRINSIAPRGVSNRRAALSWIKNNNIKSGVLYFGDDDNTFDLTLFSEIRSTKRVSMFPVGLIGLYGVSSPVIKSGKVIGFFDSWPAMRKFPVDMAGFAVNLEFLSLSPNATMPYRAGYEEDGFLKSLGLKLSDIEPRAKNCTEILVWHTQTKKAKSPILKINSKNIESDQTSLRTLLLSLESMGVTELNSDKGEIPKITRDGKSKKLNF